MSDSAAPPYQTGSVTSADGTEIWYRQLGHGPGIVLLHGGLMAAQNFMRLAESLSDSFTLYLPDRRGRGRSGPPGAGYGIAAEVEDLQALLSRTGTGNVFGLSSGAVISLMSALELPEIRKVALYEPPLSFDDSPSMSWVPRYEREIGRGKLASALLTVIRGTGDSAVLALVPRFVLVPLLGLSLKAQAKGVHEGDVSMAALVPLMHYDARVVSETGGELGRFRAMRPEVLLLGGSKSAAYLHTALDRLGAALPRAERVELPGVGHAAADNAGRPELVAAELRRFFAATRNS